MTSKPPLDFNKVEALRKHMLLTTDDFAQLFGVSRMAYYGWVKGKRLRKANDERVREVLKQLLMVMNDHQWPTPDVIALDRNLRMQRLLEILEKPE